MFDFGFWELILVAIIGLIVIGPERLPRVAKLAGHYIGRVREFAHDFKMQIENEAGLSELKDIVDDQKKTIRQLQKDVHDNVYSPTEGTIKDAIESGRYSQDDAKSSTKKKSRAKSRPKANANANKQSAPKAKAKRARTNSTPKSSSK